MIKHQLQQPQQPKPQLDNQRQQQNETYFNFDPMLDAALSP